MPQRKQANGIQKSLGQAREGLIWPDQICSIPQDLEETSGQRINKYKDFEPGVSLMCLRNPERRPVAILERYKEAI